MSVDLLPTPSAPVARIGETAGQIWRHLHESGPSSLTGLAEQLNVSRDLTMQAIGWLAREGKVEITEAGRKRTIALKAGT